MVSTDHTSSFRSILAEKQTSSTSSSRSKSPIGRGRSPGGKGNKGKGKESGEGDDEEFLKEAYRIQTHLVSLTTLLGTIRKPYLSLNSAPPRRARDQAVTEDDDGLKKWEGSKFLTDREKDEIDLRSKLILRRCRDRTAILEEGEKARQKTLTQPSSSHNFLTTLLPSLTSSPSTSNLGPLITAHRASVLWFLNDRMAKISTQISDMQEERAKRRDERGKSLGGLAAREAAQLGLLAPKAKPGPFAFMTDSKANDATDPLLAIKAEGGEEEEELTKEQIQQFQLENNAMLEHMESQLTSVLSAEKSIMEISSLQTELIGHLTQQSEMVDLLYDQAIGSVGEIDKANEQLKKARQRGEEGRYFLLIFLIGASLALLFLDWYA